MPDGDPITERVAADDAELAQQLLRQKRARYEHEFGADGRFTVFRDGDGHNVGEDLLLESLHAHHFVLAGRIYPRPAVDNSGDSVAAAVSKK
jgi:hypothetical protein